MNSLYDECGHVTGSCEGALTLISKHQKVPYVSGNGASYVSSTIDQPFGTMVGWLLIVGIADTMYAI